jgi:hypothetical protein
MSYFSNIGRRIPSAGVRVFNQIPSEYYRLEQPVLDYEKILNRLQRQEIVKRSLDAKNFKNIAESLIQKISNDAHFQNLLKGVHIPFAYEGVMDPSDLGETIESKLLPSVQRSFNDSFPSAQFKAVLQSNSKLLGNIKLAEHSRYEQFLAKAKKNIVVGWYFPQALQEFDIYSQRMQMLTLPNLTDAKICLSGPVDICSALVGCPELLISSDFYAPILCMSAFEHSDPRLVLLMKSYGPNLEFWCMTQMLTNRITQVSEQWSGGLCIFV